MISSRQKDHLVSSLRRLGPGLFWVVPWDTPLQFGLQSK